MSKSDLCLCWESPARIFCDTFKLQCCTRRMRTLSKLGRNKRVRLDCHIADGPWLITDLNILVCLQYLHCNGLRYIFEIIQCFTFRRHRSCCTGRRTKAGPYSYEKYLSFGDRIIQYLFNYYCFLCVVRIYCFLLQL